MRMLPRKLNTVVPLALDYRGVATIRRHRQHRVRAVRLPVVRKEPHTNCVPALARLQRKMCQRNRLVAQIRNRIRGACPAAATTRAKHLRHRAHKNIGTHGRCLREPACFHQQGRLVRSLAQLPVVFWQAPDFEQHLLVHLGSTIEGKLLAQLSRYRCTLSRYTGSRSPPRTATVHLLA